MKKLISFIPNLLTLCNLLCGGLAICALLLGGNCLFYVSLFLLLAALFDVLDGLIARLIGAESAIGADLDSLSDVVSFGIAPTLLVSYSLKDWFLSGVATDFFFLIPLFIPALCGAYRLARFNNSKEHSSFFTGMPIPANALFWVGYAFVMKELSSNETISPRLLYGLTLLMAFILGFLMVSRFHFLSFKGLSSKTRLARIVLLAWILLGVLLVILLLFMGIKALAVFILGYAILSICLNPLIAKKQ